MKVSRSVFAAVALSFGVCACGTTDATDPKLGYSGNAQQNYQKGVDEFKNDNFPDAIKYFSLVKQKFPFSKYAVLSELRMADTQFARGRYVEAIDEYKMFERAHPTHEFVENGYAGFRVCESYYKQIPDDFFLIPPSFEKDQSPTREALREFDEFIKRFPQSRFVPQTRKYRQDAVRSLAQSELYVAKFYLARGKARAAAWRLETLLKLYSGTSFDPQVLLMLGDAYERLGEIEKARQNWTRLLSDYQTTAEASAARQRLDRVSQKPHSEGESSALENNTHG